MVDDVRVRARRELQELGLSMESASYLVDDRPPGGGGSLVTNEVLALKLDALRSDLRAEMAALSAGVERQLREQTRWLAGLVFVAFGIFATLVRFL